MYSPEERTEIINRVCKHIAENNASLRDALMLHDMPNRDTFYDWIKDNKTFSDQYARACRDRADNIFEEILEISDEENADVSVVQGQAIINGNAIQRSRLKIDARKWVLSKMNPKKYGDKLDLTTKDESIKESIDLSKLSTEDLLIYKSLHDKLSTTK